MLPIFRHHPSTSCFFSSFFSFSVSLSENGRHRYNLFGRGTKKSGLCVSLNLMCIGIGSCFSSTKKSWWFLIIVLFHNPPAYYGNDPANGCFPVWFLLWLLQSSLILNFVTALKSRRTTATATVTVVIVSTFVGQPTMAVLPDSIKWGPLKGVVHKVCGHKQLGTDHWGESWRKLLRRGRKHIWT